MASLNVFHNNYYQTFVHFSYVLYSITN
uniref:Uncharacterized protein n=1 Tax=Anguilla anguilla TaxID=7936 RepID=A0A0E9PSR4_ANGAN